ncbi:biotin-[acetyl-CoA-carboxylase] ligase BirA-like protein [Deinococcus yavapaiensis KR-236]|uniref:biotin--[biotin carboxyl-carrier protein] ligase n=2 Tax=Deinococcus TaxID=1298 RepID=A0A318S503_9DEIO|nr:biotin-[acetyl-CoA-carboxylase] ligase BirA-like protein [Deinococcus yavapaiensis KR-236]
MFSVQLGAFPNVSSLALAPLAVAVALRSACGVGGLKWPNDLLAPDGRKLAGILLEADVRGGQVRAAVLGVGVNVSGAPEGAASLVEFRAVHRPTLLRDLLWQIEVWLSAPPARVLDAWRSFSVTLNREVHVRARHGDVVGVARDVAADGALLVEVEDKLVRVEAGDVALIGTVASEANEFSNRTTGGAI